VEVNDSKRVIGPTGPRAFGKKKTKKKDQHVRKCSGGLKIQNYENKNRICLSQKRTIHRILSTVMKKGGEERATARCNAGERGRGQQKKPAKAQGKARDSLAGGRHAHGYD